MSKEKALEELEEIRQTGKFNMINMTGVLNYANENNMFFLIDHVVESANGYSEKNRRNYFELLEELI